MKKILLNTLKPVTIVTSYLGFSVGVVGGCFTINRRISIAYENKRIILKESLPLISGIICAVLFPSLLCSPIIAFDYIGNLCTVDKIIDKIDSTYLFEYKRYHQYGMGDEKYLAPPHLYFTITKK